MCQWVMQGMTKTRVLEPAFGLGVFSRVLARHHNLHIDAYEIDPLIFAEALSVCPTGVNLLNQDYFTSDWNRKYDAIVCNPPYLKFHDYDNATYVPDVNSHLGTKLNGFTNLYTLFLLKSIAQLQEGGRLAYIVPSEFLNSDYGVEVKRALTKSNTLRHIIIVDFTECAFDDALTTACIVLCEKSDGLGKVRFSRVKDTEDLYSSLDKYVEYPGEELSAEVKWKSFYEGNNSLRYNHLVPFSTFAKVSRGIATGANDYFTFKQSKIDDFNIPEHFFRRCICHAADVQNLFFTNDDFERLAKRDKTVYLFNGCADAAERHVADYIRRGEEKGVNKKYLTASRNPWYALENREPSPIWVSVFNRNGLRFVRNIAGIYNLTTFHCVYNLGSIDTDVLFAYLVTDVAKEIFLDNSRQYGNGLVKFEPNDLNRGKVVDLRMLTEEERVFVSKAYEKLQLYGNSGKSTIKMLDDFFRAKFSSGYVELLDFQSRLDLIVAGNPITKPAVKTSRIKQLNFAEMLEEFQHRAIMENVGVCEEAVEYVAAYGQRLLPAIDPSRNVLVGVVAKDCCVPFLDGSATFYYSGKRFPSTVQLSKLYYFMPYIQGKGIADLYIIKSAHIGDCKDGMGTSADLRLVLEIDRVGRIFDRYKKVRLNIWRSYCDTTMASLLSDN